MEREVALVRVDVYSAHDAFIGTIPTEELLGFSHSDTLNGEDSVSVTTLFHLKAGYRLVWKDEDGIAHEHICQDPKGYHNNGVTLYTDTALNSICETFYDYIEDKRPYSYTFAQALAVALEPTRWSVGTVDQSGTVSSGLTFYHTSAREALQAILECGGELETVITVSGQGVTKRAVNILAHRGESSTHKRFSYGKDITSVSKTEHWGAITACYGYGKGVETDSGGYGRKLTFGDINNNKNYVEDADALKTYGRPNGSGFAHKFGTYENSDCEDASQLLAETKAYLEEHKVPGVTYEADVVDLVQFDRKWEGCGVGDDVQLVDTEFEPELRLTGRVSKLVVDYIGATRSVTLGNVTETMASIYQQQQAELANISRRSSNWDATTSASPSWLNTLMGNLNEQFNTSGNSYCFTSFEQGTIWSSVPLDENGKPTKTGGSAIQLCSQGLRIASGTKSDGTFDWRSFGTGKGFTADEITAGTLTGRAIVGGSITGTTIKGNTITGGTISGTTISGGSITGSNYSISSGSNEVSISGNSVVAKSSNGEITIGNDLIIIEGQGESRISLDANSIFNGFPSISVTNKSGGEYISLGKGVVTGISAFSPVFLSGSGWGVMSGNSNNYNFHFVTNSSYLEIQTLFGSYGLSAWSSDERKKKYISDSKVTALDVINALRARRFKWRDVTDGLGNKYKGTWNECGLVAQEVEQVEPSFVIKIAEGTDDETYQISEPNLIPYLIKAVQELSMKVDSLTARLAECG